MATGKNDDLAERLKHVRHDIRNQLSNINLLIEQLRHELKDASEDQLDYLDMLANSMEKIDSILKSTE